jgi:ABC-type uncharacterized transport system permease subunit
MPRYYFYVYNDDTTYDYEGAEFADEDAARAYATTAARSLAADSALHGHLTAHHGRRLVWGLVLVLALVVIWLITAHMAGGCKLSLLGLAKKSRAVVGLAESGTRQT